MPFEIDDNKRAEANHIAGTCADWNSQGRTAFDGATYEEGVYAALVWMLGQTNDPPKVSSLTGDARPWLIKGSRHFNFTKGPNVVGGDGDTPAKAWANMGMPGREFIEWEWYEIDEKGQPMRGFDAQGLPLKSRGDTP